MARSSHLRCSIKKAVVLNSACCETFKSAYFEKDLRTAATENVFMKLRKIKNYS